MNSRTLSRVIKCNYIDSRSILVDGLIFVEGNNARCNWIIDGHGQRQVYSLIRVKCLTPVQASISFDVTELSSADQSQ